MKGPEPTLTLPPLTLRALQLLVALGGVVFAFGLYQAPDRTWADALLASYLMLELSLAATFFLAVHYMTGASWHVALRRVPEAMALVLPLGAAALLVVLLLRPGLYPWFTAPPSGEPALAFKHAWLNRPFFLARAVVYVAGWTAFAQALVRLSYRQDRDGDPALGRQTVRWSAGFLVTLALTLVPASIDWIMSLEPVWYSTIFGFYDFAGMFIGGLAALVILIVSLHRLAPATFTVTPGHLHDLGKLLFGFSTFWAYLWFSQYMLIWYGNIPEEASYYVQRLHDGWAVLFLLNMLLNWAAPFALLISQRGKETSGVILTAAALVLAGRLVDFYLAVLPRFIGPTPLLGLSEFAIPAGAMALFALAVFRVLGRAPLVPLRDPSLSKSLEYGLEHHEPDGLEWQAD